MSPNPALLDFVAQAQAAAVPHETIVGILTSQGWTEKEVYEALAEHLQLTGHTIPRRPSATPSAKEAFFYLLLFSALATWTIAFSTLAFSLIDRWLSDPLFYPGMQYPDLDTITSSLAALLVAFPLYLLLARAITRQIAAHPGERESPVRKWLTYLALVIAACVFMGDLITALSHLLRGELTSIFIAKSVVVLALSGGVFGFYFGGLRKPSVARQGRIAALASAAVALLVIFAFLNLGTPQRQRDLRADSERIRELSTVSSQVGTFYATHASKLPSALAQTSAAGIRDPITQSPYEYHPLDGSHFQLCATFSRPSDPHEPRPNIWAHPSGHHCFTLEATTVPGFSNLTPRY